jgi:hypothetical protein
MLILTIPILRDVASPFLRKIERAPEFVYDPAMPPPGRLTAKPLADLLGKTFGDIFAKQGFASRELVMRWSEIVGAEVAAHAEPIKIQWQRPMEGQPEEPATLVLRVEGPVALEIQHAAGPIIERVNRFLGWNAIGRLSLRQAPLTRARPAPKPKVLDPAAVERAAGQLGAVEDDTLRAALARLSVSLKRT